MTYKKQRRGVGHNWRPTRGARDQGLKMTNDWDQHARRDHRDDYSSDEEVEFVRRSDRTPPSTQPSQKYDLSAFRAAEELMRLNQGQPSRRGTARQAPDSADAFNNCLKVGKNVKENRVKGAHFEPAGLG